MFSAVTAMYFIVNYLCWSCVYGIYFYLLGGNMLEKFIYFNKHLFQRFPEYCWSFKCRCWHAVVWSPKANNVCVWLTLCSFVSSADVSSNKEKKILLLQYIMPGYQAQHKYAQYCASSNGYFFHLFISQCQFIVRHFCHRFYVPKVYGYCCCEIRICWFA